MADVEKLKRETQSLLSSLIISSAKGLTVRRLRKDYNDEIGEDVPFKKLGFLSFDQFLQSIPETCRLIGAGDNAVVAPVITDKTKHINDMIMKQRPPKSNRPNHRHSKRNAGVYFNNKPLARPPPAYSLPIKLPVFSENAHKRTLPPPPEYFYEERKQQTRFIPPRMMRANDNVQPSQSTTQQLSNKTKPSEELNTSSGSTNVLNDTNSSSHMCDSSFRDEYHTELQFSDYEDDDDFDEEFLYKSDNEEDEVDVACSTMNLLTITTRDEEAQLRNVDTATESRVNDRVKEKLQTLISEHADGIWCSKLIKLYNDRFKQKLDPLDYGFSSVIQMCEDVRDIFHILRPNRTDWKLFDKRKPIPKIETTEDFSKYLLTIPKMEAGVCSNTEPALPENYVPHLTPFQYPEGVLHPGDEISRQWLLGDEKEDSYIEVIVAEVYDPSKFWIQLRGEQTSVALSTLMDEMQAFYLYNAKSLRLSLLSTRIGLYCAALFMNEYHRAVIIKIYDDETMKVFYIDYGTIAEVQVRQTCFLHHDFARLPAQAIRARLANILPVQQNTMWPREATRCMMRLIMEKDLIALISAIDYEQHILEVFLTDTSLPDVDIHINDVLIDEGFAIVGKEAPLCSSSRAAVPNVHRCPTFPEIERGVYPSIGDVVRLLKLGHTYEQIFRGYFLPSVRYSPTLEFSLSSYDQQQQQQHDTKYNNLCSYDQQHQQQQRQQQQQQQQQQQRQQQQQQQQRQQQQRQQQQQQQQRQQQQSSTVEYHMSNYDQQQQQQQQQHATEYNNMRSYDQQQQQQYTVDTRAQSNNTDQCKDSISVASRTSASSDSTTHIQSETDSTNIVQQSSDQTHSVDSNYTNTHTPPVHQHQESDTTEQHTTQTPVNKPPPGFENVQPVTNPQDNTLLKMLHTYPAANLLSLATLGYPLHYTSTPAPYGSVLGGLGVYNSYLVGQYLQQQQQQEYYQQCHALEQVQRLAAMQKQQQQQQQKTKYIRNRKSPGSTVTDCKREEQSPDNCQRYVVELKINDSVLHVLKLDDELYVVSQEILTNLIKTKLSLKAWLFANHLDMHTFPNKLVNIMQYEHVYRQIKSFSIPGVYPPNNLGCNLRLTLLTDVVSIIRKYGSPATLTHLQVGLQNIQSPELWKSLNSTD